MYPTTPDPGSVELIYRYIVTGADKASIDTGVDAPQGGTNDWADGDLLEIFMLLRDDNAAAITSASGIVNNDSGANYDRIYVRGINTTVTAAPTLGTNQWTFLGHGSGGSASYPVAVHLAISGYARTTFNKVAVASYTSPDATAANDAMWQVGLGWRSTAAITRFKVTADSAALLKVGSSLLVYKRLS